VRAAHIWQQYKGGHFRLLFGRKKLIQSIEQALK
jgi:CII-binding regulator of phage lambda lysogenization HflD